MSEFIGFLKEYKEVLITGLCLILGVITLIVKRRPKTIDDFIKIVNDVCLGLPSLIIQAECPGNGLSKKKEVRSRAIHNIEHKLQRPMSESELDFCYKTIDQSIEAILSTPQKKVC